MHGKTTIKIVVFIVTAGDDLYYNQYLFPTATLFPVPTGAEVTTETVQLLQPHLTEFTPVNAGDLEHVGGEHRFESPPMLSLFLLLQTVTFLLNLNFKSYRIIFALHKVVG
jgi:hypothetical protein